MGLFDSPANRAFLGKKVLSDEEKAKKEAADTRKKKVEKFVDYEEKLEAIAKLQAEIHVAKMDAVQASPGVFAMGIGSPALNLGPDGLAGVAKRGGVELAQVQARLAGWLRQQDPNQAGISAERRAYIEQYQLMEAYLRQALDENAHLQNDLINERTIHQRQQHAFEEHFDDGADPMYEEQLRRRRRVASHPGGGHYRSRSHGHHGYPRGSYAGHTPYMGGYHHGHPDGFDDAYHHHSGSAFGPGYGHHGYPQPHHGHHGHHGGHHYDDFYDPRGLPPMSPGMARARAAEADYERFYGRAPGFGPGFV